MSGLWAGLWAGIKPVVTMRSYAERLNAVFEFTRMMGLATVWLLQAVSMNKLFKK